MNRHVGKERAPWMVFIVISHYENAFSYSKSPQSGEEPLSNNGKIFPSGSGVKKPPGVQKPQETWVWSLGREYPLEKETASHSSVLAWRIPMDGGAWGAVVHGVTGSDTTERLSVHNTYKTVYVRAVSLHLAWKRWLPAYAHAEIHFYNIILSDRSRGNQPGLIILSSDVLEEERIRRSLVTCGPRGKISWWRKGDFWKKWRNLRSELWMSWKRRALLKAH